MYLDQHEEPFFGANWVCLFAELGVITIAVIKGNQAGSISSN